MARGLCFADAVVLLGGRRSRIVASLDRLTGGVLLAASASGAGFVLNLFDAKTELFRLTGELIAALPGKLRGADRMKRTERLAAANAVAVVASFFQALGEIRLPFDVADLELTATEQVTLATGRAHSRRELASALVRSTVPAPAPHRPYEETVAQLRPFYDALAVAVARFVSGLAVWERTPGTDKATFEQVVREQVPDGAVRNYQEMFLRLATRFPEFAFWANLVDHQATREEIRELRTGLAGLEVALTSMSAGRVPNPARTGLDRGYRAALDRPALDVADLPDGLRVPVLAKLYVNPDFRAAQGISVDEIADQHWWSEQPRRADLQQFLAGYLTSSAALDAPLLVLGQPGSGKSMLTRVLAARLPAGDFLTVRVPLREVLADTDVQSQIEQAVRAATGESLTWPELVRAAGDALPVVLIDGFDELLQASGITQTDYLEKVARFQQREADLGRPLVVVVTTRISVADRARPVADMVTVLLEPFDDGQITRWLGTWSEANTAALAERGLCPLPPEVALANPELARQPLLLLLLALYDADGNPLQHQHGELNEAQLYERLLTAFARREILKSGADLPADEVDRAIEEELLTLSVVAFAMFNRQRLWVSETELDTDLAALLGPGEHGRSAAQAVVGRFYFVHVAQAVRDRSRHRTYEFLHATFGEYLVARVVVQELTELARLRGTPAARSRPRPPDDSFLHALLSFAPLTMRATVVSFLADLLASLTGGISDVLLSLFHTALEPRRNTAHESYQPAPAKVPQRHAVYSANLCLLAVIAAGEVTGDQLFPHSTGQAEEWATIARLWQSQFPTEGWLQLTFLLAVSRDWDGERRVVRISHRTSDYQYVSSDPYWIYNFSPGSSYRRRPGGRFSWIDNDLEVISAETDFLCWRNEDILLHTLEPLLPTFGRAIATFHDFTEHGPVTAVQALITLWLASTQGANQDELTDAAETCLMIAIHGFAPFDDEVRHHYRVLVLRQLATIRHRLDPRWLTDIHSRIRDAPDAERKERAQLIDLAAHIVPPETE